MEEQETALREFDQAGKMLKKGLVSTKGGMKAEKAYDEAYQRLVTLGLRPQVRHKYRAK